jgi:putative hydrolase of the HAD superfamily
MPEQQTPEEETELDRLNRLSRERMEALTPAELEEFKRRVKERASSFTPEERTGLLREARSGQESTPEDETEADSPPIDPERLAILRQNFFPELPDGYRPQRLVQGILFDLDNTLARLTQPLEALMESGAKNAEAYMRATGMEDLPENLWQDIIEARIFAQTKSDDEMEEHTAEDTLSFLLQFVGYPISRMDPDVLHRAVDLFYAPEMTAWEPLPAALETLEILRSQGYRLALIGHYAWDRAFQRIVDYTGLRPYFDICLSSASVEWRKPHSALYEILLKRWDVEPYELVCVGDSLKHDISGGLELGAQTVHCRMIPLAEDQRIVEAVIPDRVIDHLSQLPALIHEWS